MSRPLKSLLVPALCASTFLGLSGGVARAADVAAAPPPAPANWWDTITYGGTIESGILFNPDSPADGLNFGHLFTDKANTPLLNQILLTVQRPLDPKATGYDFGFKLQAMYGTDARYTHYLGEFDYAINDWSQITPVEAWGIVHTPWLFAGGIDIKAGQFVTLEGAETIDPTTNYFYSHSYVFNFGIPLVDTGIMTIAHVDPLLDVYLGIVTGENTTFGNRQGDNNGAAAFEGGLGLNLLGGNLTILATTHIGPETADTLANQFACGCNPNSALRYLNDITATWKVNDNLTLITDANYIRDDAFPSSGYGVAQYAVYKINDWLSVAGRAEVWRDNGYSPNNGLTHGGFFVGAFPGNFDFVNAEYGFPNTSFTEVPTTYLALTAGLNIAPPIPDGTPFLKGITFRPEVRYDTSLNGTAPFDGAGGFAGIPGTPGFGAGTKSSQVTFGGDVIAKF
jgi:Putative beta-barrel porin-2, OmpL-like. bbp2